IESDAGEKVGAVWDRAAVPLVGDLEVEALVLYVGDDPLRLLQVEGRAAFPPDAVEHDVGDVALVRAPRRLRGAELDVVGRARGAEALDPRQDRGLALVGVRLDSRE